MHVCFFKQKKKENMPMSYEIEVDLCKAAEVSELRIHESIFDKCLLLISASYKTRNTEYHICRCQRTC